MTLRTAQAAVDSMPVPTNAKDYKASVMSVAKVVSSKLGNTPAVALTSYINPSVFVPWRVAA
jgi:DNA topoisomerase IB